MKYGIRVLAILAVLLAGMLGMAGCGDDDVPAATASSSVASGGTSSATSVPATFTEDMSLPQSVRDYYRSAYGKSGAELKTALQTIITTGHTVKTYNDLWTLYKTADVAPNGRVWDMYTSTNAMGLGSVFIFGTDQDTGSGGTTELDVYNREHTWPQNTFGEWATARHDGHHVTPTDKLVNNKRSSYAYGEVSTATWTSQNGSKLGSARSGLGFTGTVFEPITIYKGDHARMHFYMAVRYAGSSYFTSCDWANPGADLKDWYKTMLINWHAIDPLHSKEVNRNNAIYGWQGNRNPFIDYPVLVSMLFGVSSGGTTSSVAASSSAGTTSSAASSVSTGPVANSGDLVAANTDFEADFATGAYAFQTAPAVSYSTEAAYAGTRSIKVSGTAGGSNGYLFSIGSVSPRGSCTKITFWLKGTVSGKSLSINLNGGSGPFYNLATIGSSDVSVSAGTSNAYDGSIDTGGAWVKVSLTGLAADPTDIAFKFGKTGVYNLYIDDVRYE